MSAAEQYANWVLAPENERRTGRLIKLASERFLSDLKRTDIYFDEAKANQCSIYCERYLCLWEDKWRGKPMDFKPWMQFIFQQIYGWIRVDTGLRRIRKVYVQVAKKNAKSTLAGGLVDFHLMADENVSTPSVFIGANNEEQARICLKIAGKIIENSPALEDWLHDEDVQLFYNYGEINKIVLHPDPERDNREGTVSALSKEGSDKKSKTSGGKHGKNPSVIVIDEYGMAADDNQLNDMESGQAARDEPLLFVITTAGFNMDGPCYSKFRKTGIGVLEGTLEDDSFLVIIYEPDKPIGDDGKPKEITIQYLIDNEDVWDQSNPNIDVSVSREFLRGRLRTARNEGGTKEVDVKTLNFNLWCESPETWIPADVWNANSHGISEKELPYVEGFAGIEIVSGLSLNALILIFPNVSGEIMAVKSYFWLPENKVRENEIKFDFTRWVEEGFIVTSPGDVIDNDIIFNFIQDELKKFQIHSLAYSVNLAQHDILQALNRASVTCNPISQGYRGQTEPTLAWEELLTAGKVEHFNNPVLAWMNSNCMIIRKNNDVMLQKAGGRVAGISACIHALAQYKTIEGGRNDNDAIIEKW